MKICKGRIRISYFFILCLKTRILYGWKICFIFPWSNKPLKQKGPKSKFIEVVPFPLWSSIIRTCSKKRLLEVVDSVTFIRLYGHFSEFQVTAGWTWLWAACQECVSLCSRSLRRLQSFNNIACRMPARMPCWWVFQLEAIPFGSPDPVLYSEDCREEVCWRMLSSTNWWMTASKFQENTSLTTGLLDVSQDLSCDLVL